jgi:hypothetical protein
MEALFHRPFRINASSPFRFDAARAGTPAQP